MPRLSTSVAWVALAAVADCATPAPSVTAPTEHRERRREPGSAWPDEWGIRFAQRCQASGEDIRFCVCLASEVQQRFTPAELRERGLQGFQDGVRACRERVPEP
jgi:hypothetical protein